MSPAFAAVSLLQLATFGLLAHVALAPVEHTGWILPVLAASALPLLALFFVLPRTRRSLAVWGAIALVGLAPRVVLFASDPFLSDDVYRYVWDGRVQHAGFAPYGVPPIPTESLWKLYGRIEAEGRAPTEAELAQIEMWTAQEEALVTVEADSLEEQRVRSSVNHPEIPTIYPPLLELTFRMATEPVLRDAPLLARAGPLAGWRFVALAFELVLVIALAQFLVARGRDPRWVALYWWHPLAIVENSWSAHAEVVAVALFLIGLAAFARGRSIRGSIGIGLAGAAKLLPFGLVPLLWRRFGWRVPLIVGGVAALTVVPYLDVEGWGPAWLAPARDALAGFDRYATSWYFNDVLFRPLGFALGLDPEDRTLASTRAWRLGLQVAWVAVCLFAALRWGRARERGGQADRATAIARGAFAIIVGFVLLTPTLHPWYLVWLLPLAILVRSAAAYTFTLTVLVSYGTKLREVETGNWSEEGATRIWQFAPVLVVLVVELIVRRRRAGTGAASSSAVGSSGA